MSAVTPEVMQIEREIREAGGEPAERLRAKCRWEAMGRYAVIREWGDPRTWAPLQSVVQGSGAGSEQGAE